MTPPPVRRLGVFGGTFDPIHVAHLAVAEWARDALRLDRVLFIPAGRPPHKPGVVVTDGEERLAMVELAIADNPAFEASRIELDRAGPSYTIDTLTALAAADVELTLILSAEAFAGLPTWHEPARVVESVHFAVAPRDGYAEADRDLLGRHFPAVGRRSDDAARVTFLDGPRLRLSASDLRARAAAGRSLRYLVPDAVVRRIGDHGLYRTTPEDPST